jgi:hypothetical protein
LKANSTHSPQSQLFLQPAELPVAGQYVQVLGNILETDMLSHYGQAQNFATWSSYNSTQLEWFGLHLLEESSLQKVFVEKVDV